MPPRDSMMSEASMAGPWPKRSHTPNNPYALNNSHPMTVMSFAQGLAPTPSQTTLASTIYSTNNQAAFPVDAPPVPTIPEEYVRPHIQKHDKTEEIKGIQTPGLIEEPPVSSFPYDRERQQSVDETLAKLEGTYVSLNASDETLNPQHRAERQRQKFAQWQQEHTALCKKNAQRTPSPPISPTLPPQAPPPLMTGDGYPVPPPPPGERIPSLLFLTSEERRARAQKDFDEWCRQKRPEGKKGKKPSGKTRPMVSESSHMLKGLIKKAKDAVNGTSSPDSETGRLPLTTSQHAALAERNIYPVIQAYPGVPFHDAPNGEPDKDQLPKDKAPLISLSAAQQKFLGRPDLNPIFAAMPTHIPEHVPIHASRPMQPAKVIGHPDRGTIFEDFILAGDLPDTADETFAGPEQSPDYERAYENPPSPPPPSSSPAARHREPRHQRAAKYAASYRRAIATPPPQSPADFAEIRHADFPSHKRVLFDPHLSSYVEMLQFAHYDPRREDGVAVAKSRRESKVLEFRKRNSSRFVLGEGGEWRQESMPAF